MIHLPELLIAEHDVQLRVGVDEGARHVVESNLELCLDTSTLVPLHWSLPLIS